MAVAKVSEYIALGHLSKREVMKLAQTARAARVQKDLWIGSKHMFFSAGF